VECVFNGGGGVVACGGLGATACAGVPRATLAAVVKSVGRSTSISRLLKYTTKKSVFASALIADVWK